MTAFPLNPDLIDTGTPPIPEARGWLAAYGGRHGPAIDMSQAAPGSAPPDALLAKAAEAAGAAEAARYGAIHGETALREALAADIGAAYGGDVAATDVMITAGCNQAYVAATMALARAGDAVILPAPWYFNHQMTLRMLGIEARALSCLPENGFVPDVASARALIDGRVRAIVLVTPNNPTGAVYPPATIAAFAGLAREAGIALIIDETYRDFMPDGAGAPHGLFAEAGWRDTVIHLYSFSKAYAVPGWRLGALVTGPAAQEQICKVQDSLQICAARGGQAATAWGVGALAGWRTGNRAMINGRAAAFRRAMSALNGWSIDQAGAYFAYVRHPFGDVPAGDVARLLATRWGILALPGPYFGPGQQRHLRMAFANVDEGAITQAVARLALAGRG